MAPKRMDPMDIYDPTHTSLAAERARLVRLCARLAGDPDAAEDLAQETLLEAWRLRDRLRQQDDTDARARWLTAIARNVCLRWQRSRGFDHTHFAIPPLIAADNAVGARRASPADLLEDSIPDAAADLELELERDELADLLDRALALLPLPTREVLIARFIHEKPQAEVAARLGVTEDVVAQRLRRGKLTLRRILTTDLRHEAAPYLALSPEPETPVPDWQETRIWCPFCGRHRLQCYIDRETGAFALHCAGNCLADVNVVGLATGSPFVGDLASPKSILARHCLALSVSYRQAIANRADICCCCGSPASVRLGIPDVLVPDPLLGRGIYVECPRCGILDSATTYHLTIDTPQAIAFWRRHPRIRPLPIREIEYAGQPALLSGFESVGESARVEIISACDTWETLHAEEGGAR